MATEGTKDAGQQAVKRLTKADVLATAERMIEDCYVEALGGVIPVASLTAWEHHKWQQAMITFEFEENGKFKGHQTGEAADILLFSMGVRDSDGPWFTYEEAKDLPNAVITAANVKIRALSGMDLTAEEAEGN